MGLCALKSGSLFLCSDGQGRSGTFAALCSVLERVKTEQVVDVFQTIKALRIQRPGLVKDVVCFETFMIRVTNHLLYNIII